MFRGRDPSANRTITQYVIAFFPRNANGLTIPTRIIASKELTGVHQVTVVGDEVLVAVQGNRAGNPPVFGGLAVYEATQSSTLNPDGRTLSDVSVKRLLRAGDLQGGLILRRYRTRSPRLTGNRAVDDQEWFAAFPDRNYRLRPALPEEALPERPGVRVLAIVGRGRAPFVFLAGRDFARLDTDREIATLLSQLTKTLSHLHKK